VRVRAPQVKFHDGHPRFLGHVIIHNCFAGGHLRLVSGDAAPPERFGALAEDDAKVPTDAQAQDLQALAAHCQAMTTDADNLQGEPPVPVPSVNAEFQQGLTRFAQAGQECATAMQDEDLSGLKQAIADLNKGATTSHK
jgi:hypothetical protein